jgi:hypothetical protein
LAESRAKDAAIGRIRIGVAVVLAAADLASAERSRASGFEEVDVHFEQNATDGDVEVVFRAKGGDEGLARLRVVSPDGRTVIDFAAPDASTLGIRQFDFESPEPADVEGLKAAYPEGVYRFSGETAAGERLRGESRLAHDLPATASFLRPAAGARNVSGEELEIGWTPVAQVSGYVLEIEQDELDVTLEVRLPAAATSFSVPAGFLRPGTEYELAIGTVTAGGNVSFVETSFTTAE